MIEDIEARTIKTSTIQSVLDDNYMIGGFKAIAGIDRIIPIHSKVKPYIEECMLTNGKYLISQHGDDVIMRTEFYRNNIYYPALEYTEIEKNHQRLLDIPLLQ